MLSVKHSILTSVAILASALTAATAFGFGTIHGLGQDAEHERIAR